MSSEYNQTDETEQLIKNKGERKKSSIWEYYNESERKDGHASCKYKYCFWSQVHGEPLHIQAHLALSCSKVPYEVKIQYLLVV